MLLSKIVDRFESLVFQNQTLSKFNLKAFGSGLFGPLDNSDQLKSGLEQLLRKKVSNNNYQPWLENLQDNLKKTGNENDLSVLTTNYWSTLNNYTISVNLFGGPEEWILTKDLNKLKQSYEESDQDLNIRKSYLLPGNDSIPTLHLAYVLIEEPFNLWEPEQESQDIAHNLFIAEALRSFFGPAPKEDIEDFINTNKQKINYLRQSFEHQPQILGSGVDGVAFSIGPSKILKIFQDEHAYSKALEAWERLHESPASAKTEAMIYDVGIIGNYLNYPLYYYMMERMLPIRGGGSSWNNAEENLHNMIVYIKNEIANNKSIVKPLKDQYAATPNQIKLNNKIKSVARQLASKVNSDFQSTVVEIKKDIKDSFNVELNNDWLKVFVEEILMKYITSRTDLHTGNLGISSSGYLRYFDPAYSTTVSIG